MDFLLTLNPVLGLIIFLALMMGVGIGVYFTSRLVLKSMDRLSRQLGVYMFRACGALLGFLLAVNFSAVSIEFSKISEAVDLEVAQLHDMHEDLLRFGTPRSALLADLLVTYSRSVVDEEWESLSHGEPSEKSWNLFLQLEDGIILLEPVDDAGKILKSRMLTDIDEISDYRQSRIYGHDSEMLWLRIIVYVMFILSIFYLGVFATRPIRLLFVGLYSGAIGLILYAIISMGHPYQGVAQVSSEPFQRLNEELRATKY